jgi:hypothetical protein
MPGTGVEVELERGSIGIGEVLARVEDELEPAHRAGQRVMRQHGGELPQSRAVDPALAHGLHVDVAAQAVEVAERAGADHPRRHEAIPELRPETGRELPEVLGEIAADAGRWLR